MTTTNTATSLPALDVQTAEQRASDAALAPTAIGPVGLELEFHLVDLLRPERVPEWTELTALLRSIPGLPRKSSITTEPGGQLELSSPPGADIVEAVDSLRADEQALREALQQRQFGLAPIGADPARPLRRIMAASRYVAMERHFDALGCGRSGRSMMSSTAALQVNLNAGPRSMWVDRIAHLHAIGPVLTAISACSPVLAGHASGWRSMRQETWFGIDPARSAAMQMTADPAAAWASFALDAPVMLVRDRDGAGARAATQRITFRDWVRGSAAFDRSPTVEDLDYHLTTLFPPARLRGYLELRCIDAVPDRWWPALAAIVTTLADDPSAADEAADVCSELAASATSPDAIWAGAACAGLADRALLRAARRCVDIAARHAPLPLRAEVERYCELVHRGRTPGDELREQIVKTGPLAALIRATHA